MVNSVPCKLTVSGLSGEMETVDFKMLHVQIDNIIQEFCKKTKKQNFGIKILVGHQKNQEENPQKTTEANKGLESSEDTVEGAVYPAIEPLFSMDRLVFSDEIKRSINLALQKINDSVFIYENWGLSEIDKNPKSAINLFGPPGTGKTAAAHAMASELGKKIIVASYADIESKFHGEGPKNVQAIFKAATDADAVLFIDEADSLLSQRLSNVTQGSEQAINSMRSQLLINMEAHRGLIVFATNFAKNYDRAFDTRLVHLNIPMPDYKARLEIIKRHIPKSLPLSESFSIDSIAEVEGVCGRDIKNAIISAAVHARIEKLECVESDIIKKYLEKEIRSRDSLRSEGLVLNQQERRNIAKMIKQKLEGKRKIR